MRHERTTVHTQRHHECTQTSHRLLYEPRTGSYKLVYAHTNTKTDICNRLLVPVSLCTHLKCVHAHALISHSIPLSGCPRISVAGASRRMMHVFCVIQVTHKVVDTEQERGEPAIAKRCTVLLVFSVGQACSHAVEGRSHISTHESR